MKRRYTLCAIIGCVVLLGWSIKYLIDTILANYGDFNYYLTQGSYILSWVLILCFFIHLFRKQKNR